MCDIKRKCFQNMHFSLRKFILRYELQLTMLLWSQVWIEAILIKLIAIAGHFVESQCSNGFQRYGKYAQPMPSTW